MDECEECGRMVYDGSYLCDACQELADAIDAEVQCNEWDDDAVSNT